MASVLRPPVSLWPAVLSHLRQLDAKLCARARELRTQHSDEASDLRGLFVSDREFEELLARPFGQMRDSAQPIAESPSDPQDADAWMRLAIRLGLSHFEAETLLLCLLPEIDLKYERIYAFLQDDVTCRRPTVDLALALLCGNLSERLANRSSFSAEAPLLRHRLLLLQAREGHGSLLSSTLQVDPDVLAFLLDENRNGPSPARVSDLTSLADEPFAPGDAVTSLSLSSLSERDRIWVYLEGADRLSAYGVGARLCHAWGLPLLGQHLANASDSHARYDAITCAAREALLYEAALLIDLTPLPGDSAGMAFSSSVDDRLAEGLVGIGHPIFFVGQRLDSLLPVPPAGVRVLRFTLSTPQYSHRRAMWEHAMRGAQVSHDALDSVAGRFRLNTDQVARAARIARDIAWQRDHTAAVEFADLAAAARTVSVGNLGQLAKRIDARHAWQDLVLPSDRIAQLRELCDQFAYRPLVYDTWGFGKQSALGQGLSALFAGPSGTGKTMAAEVIAAELSLDLYKIDLSGVVSKYIGETEKNLERIFEMARDSNAILLFDEADALFGKRSETKDAHDRYANIEISYLLQKIEEYDGVVILTSNLRQNLDEAFLRRLQFTVEFPMPDEQARLTIWQRTIPSTSPVQAGLDLEEMARRFRFSGGSIRNVLVNAAFLAARDGQILSMDHVLWAARREFQKLGKLVDEAQFSREPGRVPSWAGDGNYGAR